MLVWKSREIAIDEIEYLDEKNDIENLDKIISLKDEEYIDWLVYGKVNIS